MVLKGGQDKGKELEEEYSKKCTNCGVLKDKREFDINQIQAGDRIVRRGECKECRKWEWLDSDNQRNVLFFSVWFIGN